MPKITINAGTCVECGSLVRGTLNERRHIEFHEKFNELVEWAQDTSKFLFGQEEEVNESS